MQIAQIFSSCGCVKIAPFTSKSILPNDQFILPVSIAWESVGSGGVDVVLQCDDGSSTKIRVIRPVNYSSRSNLKPFIDSHNLIVPAVIRDIEGIDVQFIYHVPREYRELSGVLSLTSSQPWCGVSPVVDVAGSATSIGAIHIKFLPNVAVLEELAQRHSVNAIVRVFKGQGEARQIGEVKVNVYREVIATVTPCILARGNTSASTTLRITHEDWILQSVTVENEQIDGTFAIERMNTRDWKVSFSGSIGKDDSGTHVANCTFVHTDATVSPIQMPLTLVFN